MAKLLGFIFVFIEGGGGGGGGINRLVYGVREERDVD